MERTRWFKDSVFYQIWPRSFKDGNGDGMGDLLGVYEKLDYIKSLGVDGIWFSPLYPSPGADCGYDVADYRDIAPEFGGMEAFQKVLDGAHERGMKVIMDLVVNHTSDEHEWFQKSRKRIDPYTDYYIWRPGTKNGKLPNNWQSNFSGNAWTWDEERGEYYLHLFDKKQPDLNMDNPLVRQEVVQIIRFWLERGVDGFREDVITYISKKEGLPNDHLFPIYKGMPHYNHGPNVHAYLQQFRREALDDFDYVTIGEAPLISPKRALEYVSEKGSNELDMMIQFQCMCADCLFTDFLPTKFHLRKLKRAFSSWQKTLDGKGWNMLYMENHDHPRIISRYGSEKYRVESGKAICTAYMFLKGTPFVYQGQEIGMLNYRPDSTEKYADVQSVNYKNHMSEEKRLKMLHRSSRDSARTAVQWDGSEFGGFSQVAPWFAINENHSWLNVEAAEKDPDSLLQFYRKAIALRKSMEVVRSGDYREYMHSSDKLYVYTRTSKKETLLVISSFSEKPAHFSAPKGIKPSAGELLLANYEVSDGGDDFITRPYETRVYRISKTIG